MMRTTRTPLTNIKMDFLAAIPLTLAAMRSNADDATAYAHQYQK